MPEYVSTDPSWKKTDSARYRWDGRGWYRLEPTSPPPPQAPEPSSGPGFLPTAIRVAGPIVGGVVGGIGGSLVAPGPGTAVGAIGGQAFGAGGAEILAEWLEKNSGARTSINPWQVLTQTAIGAIPGTGPVKSGATLARALAQRAATGAILGGASTAATGYAETGRLPAARDIALGTGFGAVTGTALGGAERYLGRRRVPAVVAEELPPVVGRVDTPLPSAVSTPADLPPSSVDPVVPTLPDTRRIVGAPRPASTAMGEPITDPLKGLDPLLRKFSPDLRDGIAARIEENGALYAKQRRGEMDTEQLGHLADNLSVNVAKVLPKGTALPAEDIYALARAMRKTQQDIQRLSVAVGGTDASDITRLQLLQAQADANVITQSLMGARAEAGRALGAFNFYRQVIETGNTRIVRDVLNAPGLRNKIDGLAEGFAAVGDDAAAQFAFLQRQAKTTLGDKARSYYYANILSGVGTHERNVLGNIGNVVSDLIVQPTAAVIAKVKGDPSIRLDELPSQAFGAVAGIEQGFKEAVFTLRHGLNPRALSRATASAETGALDIPRVEFAGGGANPLNAPGRAMDAVDTFFKSVTRNKTLYGMAHTQAKNEGLAGEAFATRMRALTNGTALDAQPLHRAADAAAERATFQEGLGPRGQYIQQALRAHPALTLMVPFFKTPTNILKQGLEFSPAGFLMQAAKQEGRLGTEAQARAAAGTIGAGFLFYLASTGRLSGSGPASGPEREALYDTGWKPNSIKINDTWRSYQPIQPLNVVASLVANGVEGWKERGADEKDIPDVIGQVLARGANSFLDQTFLSGLSDVIEAVRDPERSVARTGGRMVSGFVPLSGLLRTGARVMDPVQRSPKTMFDTVKAGLPGLSSTVPPRLNRFGQPVATPSAFDPFSSSPVKRDPVADEMRRIGYNPSRPTDRLMSRGVRLELSADQQQALEAERGQASYAALKRLIESDAYPRMTEDRQREEAEDKVSKARTRVSNKYRYDYLTQKRAKPNAR